MGISASKNKKATTTASSSVAPAATKDKQQIQRYPIIGSNDIMRKKRHGTSDHPVQETLRWNASRKEADQICNFNRHYAERSGSAFVNKQYMQELKDVKMTSNSKSKTKMTIKFYDSNTGKLLFEAPKKRTIEKFDHESRTHGWPSFRDDEVNWDNVRCLRNGECVSLDGTHLVSFCSIDRWRRLSLSFFGRYRRIEFSIN
jgi:hypothetical protein